jgi:hypothetical protein
MEKKKCSVCDSTFEEPKLIGVSIVLENTSGIANTEVEKVSNMFGKTEFHICFCCWLKSLGVKPIKTE